MLLKKLTAKLMIYLMIFSSGPYEINFGFQIIFLFLRCLKE